MRGGGRAVCRVAGWESRALGAGLELGSGCPCPAGLETLSAAQLSYCTASLCVAQIHFPVVHMSEDEWAGPEGRV